MAWADADANCARGRRGPSTAHRDQRFRSARPFFDEEVAVAGVRTADAPTPIDPGEQTITVFVSGRWRLHPRTRQKGARPSATRETDYLRYEMPMLLS